MAEIKGKKKTRKKPLHKGSVKGGKGNKQNISLKQSKGKKKDKRTTEEISIESVGDKDAETRAKKYVEERKIKEADLKLRQEKFCFLYATDADFFGNGVEAYLETYDIDRTKPNWYKTACAAASRMLSNVKVCERINELLVDCGFNDIAVDKQHAFLIAQHDDKHVKLGAIKEYNALKKRIVTKLEVSLPSLVEDVFTDDSGKTK